MKQCDIWYADLNPVKGSEQKGLRPVVIISGNILNQFLPIVIACPLTTKIKNYKGNLILEPDQINGLSDKSEVLTFHIRSISKERLTKKVGTITEEQLGIIKLTLNDILRY
ncbi:MAG: type II toxin-antitoxin system PemK/MazF family toxin [Bacteroidales bacterium]|nr:type II toxin-antitoxin system PemK/MazF family toxin [Bacteroidales bacterium]